MFAIVDIETTGGYASANGITEIAIAVYDGQKIVDYFDTLVNPLVGIPPYIQSLTGITNAMVSQAPLFEEIAARVYELLREKVFVAHNVNFDYSFVKFHLARCGFDLDCKKLCTVRLGRKIFPGQHSYSLGNLCRSLSIEIEQRHRAGGDARATVKLFEQLLCNDGAGEINLMLKGKAKDQHLPPNLPAEKVTNLPACPGVYYFHNVKGKVIYVGKAKDLRKRVASHFSNNKTGKQKQEFLRNIYDITYQECGSELMAFILESIEIKRLWPLYNRSLKGFEQAYGLYAFEDSKGYLRLVIEKKKKHLQPIYTFSQLTEGHTLVKKLIAEFDLCPRLCFIDVSHGPSLAEEQQLSSSEYNDRITKAINYLANSLPTFAVCEEPAYLAKEARKGVILMEKGRFYGMGYLPPDAAVQTVDDLKAHLTQYPENGYIRGLVYQYSSKHPERKLLFTAY